MIVNAVIQPKQNDDEMFFDEVVAWCHQCYQRHILENDIDLEEFKRRLNVSDIDYKKFIIDYADQLEAKGKLYVLRVMHILFPDEYNDPDKE